MNVKGRGALCPTSRPRPGIFRSQRKSLRGLALAALLLPIACGKTSDEPRSGESASRSSEAAPIAGSNAIDNAAVADNARVDFSTYVGKHPAESVDGTRFLDEPAVKAAVAATVADASVRDFVFNYDGPDAPIVSKDGRILAWGCERHNCGYHNWSIAITPDGANAEICFYHNDDSADGPATWYLPGGKTEKRPGNCPSD